MAAAICSAVWGVAESEASDLPLEGQHRGRRLLARLDARLVVGVDVHQRGVEADGPLEQRDQHADRAGIDPGNGDRHRLPVVVEQGLARAEQEAVQVIAGGDAGLDLERVCRRLRARG